MNVMKLDALFGVVTGVLLLAGSWDGLYEALDLPVPKPAFYAQIAGVAILVVAYLLWTREPRELAGVVAVGNAALAAVLAVWLVTGRIEADALGTTIVVLITLALAAFAVAEARLARE